MSAPRYSRRLDDALALAADAFRHTARKGTDIPYLAHLLQVLVTVAEYGGDEDQMIAAVLHDYLEDVQAATASELRERFGERVERFVVALSDTTEHPKPPWEERKQRYIRHLTDEPPEVKLISAADKLHNVRSLTRDYRELGGRLWERFTANREQTLWYYRAVTTALAAGWQHPLQSELKGAVDELCREVGEAPAS